MGLDHKKLHICFIYVSFDKTLLSSLCPLAGEIKTNLGLSKSARALDNNNLQGAKYPIWKALQKLYKGYMGLDHKKLHTCFISVSFDKALSIGLGEGLELILCVEMAMDEVEEAMNEVEEAMNEVKEAMNGEEKAMNKVEEVMHEVEEPMNIVEEDLGKAWSSSCALGWPWMWRP